MGKLLQPFLCARIARSYGMGKLLQLFPALAKLAPTVWASYVSPIVWASYASPCALFLHSLQFPQHLHPQLQVSPFFITLLTANAKAVNTIIKTIIVCIFIIISPFTFVWASYASHLVWASYASHLVWASYASPLVWANYASPTISIALFLFYVYNIG